LNTLALVHLCHSDHNSLPERNRDHRLVAYRWGDWEGAMLPAVDRRIAPLPALIGESAADVLRRLPERTQRFVFHLDLTATDRLPLDRSALVSSLRAAGVAVLNGGLVDISKRALQRALSRCGLPTVGASSEGDGSELLIVKTDCNCRAETEMTLSAADRELVGLRRSAYPRRPVHEYRVLRRDLVPALAWHSPELCIERFVTNAEHRFCRAYVLLDRMVITVAIDPAPVKRLVWGTPRRQFYFNARTPVPGPPPAYTQPALVLPRGIEAAVARLCAEIGLQFGALDVMLDNQDRCHIVDVNTTPSWGRPDLGEITSFLAGALPTATQPWSCATGDHGVDPAATHC
jgi:hypothetical protein